jgi:hypothetical protein
MPCVLKNTVDSINDIYKKLSNSNKEILNNFYNISDPNISDNNKDLFIIYPNEYNNTNLLSQKYCITFNNNIIKNLLNKGAIPLLLDNNNQSCIHNAVKLFNYISIKDLIKLVSKDNFNEFKFIKGELINHKNKMISSTYIETFNNFIKTQFEEIKILILSNEAYGNNILYNLHNSFKMCFYIMNEYITDNLWNFSDTYTINEFNDIIKILNINNGNIFQNYLNNICNKNKDKLPNDNITLIKKEFIEILKNNKKLKEIEIKKLNEQITNLTNLKLNEKISQIRDKINKINNKINDIDKNIEDFDYEITSNIYNKPTTIKKDKIIESYDKLTEKGYGVYSEMWKLLLEDETLLSESFNLSLIKILMLDINNKKNKDIVLSYLNHSELLASQYFENPKYIDENINKNLTFIYDLLVHLTKTIICFGIEIVTRKVIFNYINNIYSNYSLDDINGIIERLFNDKNFKDNLSFLDIIYNEYPEIIVKNSINIFTDLNEKVNFEQISVAEMLQNLFNRFNNLRIVELDEIIMSNLNKNVANYFDLFTARVIKNWFVICENTLKLIINHQRISNTLELFDK